MRRLAKRDAVFDVNFAFTSCQSKSLIPTRFGVHGLIGFEFRNRVSRHFKGKNWISNKQANDPIWDWILACVADFKSVQITFWWRRNNNNRSVFLIECPPPQPQHREKVIIKGKIYFFSVFIFCAPVCAKTIPGGWFFSHENQLLTDGTVKIQHWEQWRNISFFSAFCFCSSYPR